MTYLISSTFARSLELEDKAVLITGGASGIGWAAARLFALAGARVMIADIDGSRAEARAKELGAIHLGAGVDVSDEIGVAEMIDSCVAAFGSVDVLVNNAGLTTTGGAGVIDQAPSEFDRIMGVNLGGTILASECAAAAMKAAGQGVIVNLASGAGLRPVPFRGAYSASKAGIIALTRRHARAWQHDAIRVNAVAPGYTRTELVEALISSGRVDPEAAARRIPLGRMADAAEIAAVIGFLASRRSSVLSGEIFVVDGGSMVSSGVVADQTPAPLGNGHGDRAVYLIAGSDTSFATATAQTLSHRGAHVVFAEISGDPVKAADDHECLKRALAGCPYLDGVVFAGGSGDAAPRTLQQVARTTGPALMARSSAAFVTINDGSADAVGADGGARSAAVAAALTMLTQTLAVEWSRHRVRANVIDATAAGSSRTSEVADLAHFLLSREAGFVTGSVLTVSRNPATGR